MRALPRPCLSAGGGRERIRAVPHTAAKLLYAVGGEDASRSPCPLAAAGSCGQLAWQAAGSAAEATPCYALHLLIDLMPASCSCFSLSAASIPFQSY
eukprot:COSAG01_NODE_3275_length_6319_cov_8.374277_1_plen_97_part_00